LSEICKIRNVWKLPSPFPRNTLISSSEKTYWSLKISFWNIIFEFDVQLFFQNVVFKLREVFSELEIRVFLENGLGIFHTFLILQISDKPKVLKRFQKHFWKLDSKPKKPRIL
jgi:hypothetical protein